MSRSSRQVYLLAKMYGVVAHSWLGANLRDLLRLKSLADLHGLLWPAAPGEAVEPLSVKDMESRIRRSAVKALVAILDGLGRPPDILVHMLRRFEYRNLKIALRGLGGENVPGAAGAGIDTEQLVDLGRYAALRVQGAASLEKDIRSSPYAWALGEARSASRARVESAIDRRYYDELLNLVRGLPAGARAIVLRFFKAEVALENAVWALRMRFFYGMDAQAARPLLITGGGGTSRMAVERAFEIPADSLEEWRRWRYGWLLEDQLREGFRAPDPVGADARASQRLFVRAHQLLHQYPFTICPFVAYFALKQQEAAFLTTAVEAVALGIPEKDALALAGLASGPGAPGRNAPGAPGRNAPGAPGRNAPGAPG